MSTCLITYVNNASTPSYTVPVVHDHDGINPAQVILHTEWVWTQYVVTELHLYNTMFIHQTHSFFYFFNKIQEFWISSLYQLHMTSLTSGLSAINIWVQAPISSNQNVASRLYSVLVG